MTILGKWAALSAGIAAVTICLNSVPAMAADDNNVTNAGTKAIEKIIREYLLKNPKIVNDAMEAHQRNLAEAEERAVLQTITDRQKELRHDPASVVGGNQLGDVTVVEFFDYRCGVCKRVHSVVGEVVKRDGKVRRVYKEWPILGPQSIFAARAAIASRKQGDDKYINFHDRMMETRQQLTSRTIMIIASKAGLDTAQLERDMKDPKIGEVLRDNYNLARSLKLTGTPSFLIGDTLLRGGRDADTMLQLVKEARKKS
jgi:protein-disulfide isomerase